MALTKEQENIIDECKVSDIIDYIGTDEVLENLTTLDISLHYDLDEILDEYSSNSEIANYLENKGYDFSPHIEVEEYEIDKMKDETLLVEFCRRFHPHGCLMKEDIREIINNYIDDMINNCY